ncbi:sulfite exporter TauE/SafE family protein [Clostridium sp. A1-XYC3]|uniref:Probable membrane transporter protein n=1 Tax=Clostridium tanneri TaxID=3037988 RepID=A0ABU4JNS4_9CLOT|nr:sulfite exporter TauE/SafE family protein [Clostridium sp. A1-XYC3]MDW8799794.1 sulfite exporter TauE/SafE family protein [Clostridium sp. A1-XYC3]
MLKVLLAFMIFSGVWFSFLLIKDYMNKKKARTLEKDSFTKLGIIGMIANFFDTLGIGSFAIETSLFKSLKVVEDKKIPGTLNVGCTIPTILEALIFMTVIEVDPVTLFSMLASAVLGALVGAEIVSKFNEKTIQLVMGTALLIVAAIMIAGQLKLFPVGGDAIGLTGIKLVAGIVGNFVFAALMTVGIGLYAPCMALIFALGMGPKAAFPIMMGSCAVLLPFSSYKFIKNGAYSSKAAVAITILGSAGVLIAAYLVKSLPLDTLKWVVVLVILYTSVLMFKSVKKIASRGEILENAA